MDINRHQLLSSAVLFERAMVLCDFNNFDNLKAILAAVPHISMREGYVPDAFVCGYGHYGEMRLYARALSPTGRYMPVPEEEMDDKKGDVNYPAMEGWGETADGRAFAPFADGQYVHNVIPIWAGNTVPPITSYLRVPFEPRAILEAVFLVDAAPLYLMHYGEGFRKKGRLVLGSLSLWSYCYPWNIDSSALLNDPRIDPFVRMSGTDQCLVGYCYWCLPKGPVQRIVRVTRRGDEGISIDVLTEELLLGWWSIPPCPGEG